MLQDQGMQRIRRVRSDAGVPRLQPRDIQVLRWVAEQGAANVDHLRLLLGRLSEYELDDDLDRLSVTRVRHIIEDHWLPAKVIESESILGQRWIWLTRRGLNRVDAPFSPHRPADTTVNHLHHINRVRLDLEGIYQDAGRWESVRMIEQSKKQWKMQRKADSLTYIPREYETWHMPDGLWFYRHDETSKEYKVFIEVEVSSKGVDRTKAILHDLASHGSTWYYVDADPKKHVYETLMQALGTLRDNDKQRFHIYNLADMELLYHFNPQQKSG